MTPIHPGDQAHLWASETPNLSFLMVCLVTHRGELMWALSHQLSLHFTLQGHKSCSSVEGHLPKSEQLGLQDESY